jgi:hypothetical protein
MDVALIAVAGYLAIVAAAAAVALTAITLRKPARVPRRGAEDGY